MCGENRREGWAERIVLASIDRPVRVLVAWALVGAVASIGVGELEVDTATSSFLDRTGAAWQSYERSTALFGGDEFIVVAIEGLEPFDREAMDVVARLSKELSSVSRVRRVDSIGTVPLIVAGANGLLELRPAVEGVAISEEEKTQAATMIQKDRVAAGDLVSDDGKAFAINVFLDRDVNAGRDQIVEEIIEITKGLDVAVSGVPVFRTMVNTRTRVELAMFVPFVLFLIGLVIYLSFGTLRAVLLALASAAIGTWVSLGAMGATGTPISLSTITLPPVMHVDGPNHCYPRAGDIWISWSHHRTCGGSYPVACGASESACRPSSHCGEDVGGEDPSSKTAEVFFGERRMGYWRSSVARRGVRCRSWESQY
jgi:predicted RND superfamily exporter protein